MYKDRTFIIYSKKNEACFGFFRIMGIKIRELCVYLYAAMRRNTRQRLITKDSKQFMTNGFAGACV